MNHCFHIHLGLHKTGTTAIQSYLYCWRDFLREAGVSLPILCPPFQHASARPWVEIPSEYFQAKHGVYDFWELCIAEASMHSDTIISSECLSIRHPDMVRYNEIEDILAGAGNVNFYVTLRNHVDAISSIFLEFHSRQGPFDGDIFGRCIREGLASGHLLGVPFCYSDFLGSLKHDLKSSGIVVVDMDTINDSRSNPAWRLLSLMGIDLCDRYEWEQVFPYSLPFSEITNQSIGVATYLLASCLHNEFPEITFDRFLRMATLARCDVNEVLGHKKPTLLSRAEFNDVADFVRADLYALADPLLKMRLGLDLIDQIPERYMFRDSFFDCVYPAIRGRMLSDAAYEPRSLS